MYELTCQLKNVTCLTKIIEISGRDKLNTSIKYEINI